MVLDLPKIVQWTKFQQCKLASRFKHINVSSSSQSCKWGKWMLLYYIDMFHFKKATWNMIGLVCIQAVHQPTCMLLFWLFSVHVYHPNITALSQMCCSFYKSIKAHLTPTTVLHYLQGLKQFLSHAQASQVPGCRLTKGEWYRVDTTFAMLVKGIRTAVVIHQGQAKRLKHEVLPTKKELRTFQCHAKTKIPEVLGMFDL